MMLIIVNKDRANKFYASQLQPNPQVFLIQQKNKEMGNVDFYQLRKS